MLKGDNIMKKFGVLASVLLFILPISACQSKESATVGTAMDLDARIQKLEDEAAIHRLLLEYGKRLDERDFAGYAALFARDGVWAGGMGEHKGPAAIEMMLTGSMGSVARKPDAPKPDMRIANSRSVHVLTNFIIDVDGDTATALSKWMFLGPSADNRPAAMIQGHYRDQLVREDGTWKFLRREAWGDIPFDDPATHVDDKE